jgi:hypothetical protein
MPLLLVDDRDGRIVAEVQSEEQALRVLEAMSGEEVPDYLCLVDFQSNHGSLLGADTPSRSALCRVREREPGPRRTASLSDS